MLIILLLSLSRSDAVQMSGFVGLQSCCSVMFTMSGSCIHASVIYVCQKSVCLYIHLQASASTQNLVVCQCLWLARGDRAMS